MQPSQADTPPAPVITPKQALALDALLAGATDTDAAAAADVRRETLYRWKTSDPAFIAESNRRRREIWDSSVGMTRSLVQQALRVVQASLASDALTPAQKLAAAERVLATFGAGGALNAWSGPGAGAITVEDAAEELERAARNAARDAAQKQATDALLDDLSRLM